ncbi:tetraacyldisaccharide 4'-kinase [Helicobacter sp. 11S02629-2]|uniref:tetraacyldisaccharide 4'-kinase n=1 Tax=Helicobacter sp. 11S02629-2 TaxID=1476195 RepID=UPI000BD172CB|nr:tetraacyldisaccharide 4'-kinase [Helicobacter sp. 11S02629-2]PAF44635.1 tetraacyldisaccharide 4'-kinase [Helicobacter sp. 11S02629-2]
MDEKKKKDSKLDFIESFFFYPKPYHLILAFLLLPFSFLYALFTIATKLFTPRKDFKLPIISIGNLVSGGSGKTPFCIATANLLERQGIKDVFIVSRGYKRKSKGVQVVSLRGSLKLSVSLAGDEPYLMARLTQASVIVSEDRSEGIRQAKLLGAKVIILDDGYRFSYKKLDILLKPSLSPRLPFTLPSGYYRFYPFYYRLCDLCLKEGKDYKRHVSLKHESPAMLLVTAIAQSSRLKPYLDSKVVGFVSYKDHASFNEGILESLLKSYNAKSILMTEKDIIKCEGFALPFSLLSLEISIDPKIEEKILEYVQGYYKG